MSRTCTGFKIRKPARLSPKGGVKRSRRKAYHGFTYHCLPSFSVTTLDFESQKFAQTIIVGSLAPYLAKRPVNKCNMHRKQNINSLFRFFEPSLQVIKRLLARNVKYLEKTSNVSGRVCNRARAAATNQQAPLCIFVELVAHFKILL